MVLIGEGTLPCNATRGHADGVTRTVDVGTQGGVLRRPTKKLMILNSEPTDSSPDEM